MAETKKAPVKRTIVDVTKGAEEATSATKTPKKSAGGLRLAAVIFWVLAIAAEVVAILMLTKYIFVPEDNLLMWLLIALGVDLVFLIIGSQFWKRANHIAPASKKNKFKFWLWNNMGVIVSVIAFLPILILLLNDKKLDGNTKKIVSIVAAVALAVGGLASYDWNPVSQEDVAATQAQAEELGDGQVFWTTWGRRCHLYGDCPSLNNSATLFKGTMEDAVDAGRGALCTFCENRAELGEMVQQVTDLLPEELLETLADTVVDDVVDDVDEEVDEAA
ncbi:MAG: hypothetical protein FWD25_13455 [Clostridia bacterium]|nr:hypothetical protein [Clostridia bacterium]